MIDHMAYKIALVAIGGIATAIGMVATQVDNVSDAVGGGTGSAVIVAGGAVTSGALWILVQLTRMWTRGDIVSRASSNAEDRLVSALEAVTRALDDASAAAQQMSMDVTRREELFASVIAAYLPGEAPGRGGN